VKEGQEGRDRGFEVNAFRVQGRGEAHQIWSGEFNEDYLPRVVDSAESRRAIFEGAIKIFKTLKQCEVPMGS